MREELPKRKPLRLRDFDYNTVGSYFLTICVHNRRSVLSEIIKCDAENSKPYVSLLPYGEIADKIIRQLNSFYEDIDVDYYVIMPNHIHALISLREKGASRTSPPTKQHTAVSKFVSAFKRFSNKEFGDNIWQRGFYDHIVRNGDDYAETAKYIIENPANWYFDELYSGL